MDDQALLAATASGDADAFASLYRRHLGLVTAFALRATGDPDLAADLVAEVFAAALASCRRYRPKHETAGPWLIGIAHNKLRESERRRRIEDGTRRRLQMGAIELADSDAERVVELAAADDGRLLRAVEELPPDERAAVRGRILDEQPYRDLANQLRCSESVVRQRVSRGLRHVRGQVRREDLA